MRLESRLERAERRLAADPGRPRTREDFDRLAAQRPLHIDDLLAMYRLGLFTQEELDEADAGLRAWERQKRAEGIAECERRIRQFAAAGPDYRRIVTEYEDDLARLRAEEAADNAPS